MLPKKILRQNITNHSTNEVIKIYQTDKNYPRFYNNFLRNSDNGCVVGVGLLVGF
jgi:hypothetical protein